MKNDSTQSIREAIGKYLKEEKLDGKFNEHKLIGMWQELMGPIISSRTARMFIKKKILYVNINSAPLKQELNMSKVKVLKLIHKKTDTHIIDDVKFL